MESIRTISCKLQVAPYQVAHLTSTIKAFADACNFVADYGRKNQVSVATAKSNGQAIALEDLKGVLERTNKHLCRSQRGVHNSWTFYQLAEFVRYKAARAGVLVFSVDPRYTSQTCSSCRHLGRRRGKVFSWSNCGAVLDADLNGALNIAAVGAVVSQPENSTPFKSR